MDSAMLFALGISHRTACVEQREKESLSNGRASKLLQHLAGDDRVDEVVALSTCEVVQQLQRFDYGPGAEILAPAMLKPVRALEANAAGA